MSVIVWRERGLISCQSLSYFFPTYWIVEVPFMKANPLQRFCLNVMSLFINSQTRIKPLQSNCLCWQTSLVLEKYFFRASTVSPVLFISIFEIVSTLWVSLVILSKIPIRKSCLVTFWNGAILKVSGIFFKIFTLFWTMK